MYAAHEKYEIVQYARTHTVKETTAKFGASGPAIRRWCTAAGYEPKADKVGAPKGNTNQMGGRILNTERPEQWPLHQKG